MTRRKGTKPEQFAGPFQTYDNIPARYRLKTYASEYRTKNTWEQYCNDVLLGDSPSNHMRKTARKAGQSWSDHMGSCGRHHALATPTDVNTWCKNLLSGNRNRRTCYEQYYIRIYHFYDYLKESFRHPHLYNPLLLAAIEYDTTRHLWMYRVDNRPEVTPRD
jgi:hypothetical protein